MGTVKYGGGSVMVQDSCMSAAGVGNLLFIEITVDSYVYFVVEIPKIRNLTFSNFTGEAKNVIKQKNFIFDRKNLKIGRDMLDNLTNHN